MARFEIDGSDLVLRFSTWEKLGGMRSGARVRLTDVARVTVAPDPWRILRGVRVGTGIPYVVLLGTMLRLGANDVVAVYQRRPAVVVTLDAGAPYQRLVATVPEPDTVAASLSTAIQAKRPSARAK